MRNLRFEIFRKGKVKVNKEKYKIEKEDYEVKTDGVEHYMIKEILEQPLVSDRLLKSLKTTQKNKVKYFLEEIESSRKVIFIASGSSYNASEIGAYFLRKLGIEAYAAIASEYDYYHYEKDTLVIAVSQSGETADVIFAIKNIKDRVKNVLSIVNVPYSTVQRISNGSLELKAGFEVAVAATKTFFNEVVLLSYLAEKLGLKLNINEIPKLSKEFIENNIKKIEEFANNFLDIDKLIIIGKGVDYLIAKEIALKLKEISYLFTEAIPAGEMKHGSLALIERGFKVISMSALETNIKEIESRGGIVYNIERFTKNSLLKVIIGQLLTYYIAKKKGLPIDKPRNLAKSVTVL